MLVPAAGVLGPLAWVALKAVALSYGRGFVITPLKRTDAVDHYQPAVPTGSVATDVGFRAQAAWERAVRVGPRPGPEPQLRPAVAPTG